MKTYENCPVCGDTAVLLDVVDFNKSCEENRGTFLPLSGIPIYYSICESCSFTFSPGMWNWSESDFLEKVYNEDYVKVDPDYLAARPAAHAVMLNGLFGKERSQVRHLDYGGGNGVLSKELAAHGWNTLSYDPFPKNDLRLDAIGKFNLITAFEVFEHVPEPDELMANIRALMDDSCLVLFSTLASDDHLEQFSRIDWWYCSPRNGHISLFSKASLEILASKHSLKFGSFNDGLHWFCNEVPAWARPLLGASP